MLQQLIDGSGRLAQTFLPQVCAIDNPLLISALLRG